LKDSTITKLIKFLSATYIFVAMQKQCPVSHAFFKHLYSPSFWSCDAHAWLQFCTSGL